MNNHFFRKSVAWEKQRVHILELRVKMSLLIFLLFNVIYITQGNSKPNIVFVFADDHGFHDVG